MGKKKKAILSITNFSKFKSMISDLVMKLILFMETEVDS